jgi:hypothetical protein
VCALGQRQLDRQMLRGLMRQRAPSRPTLSATKEGLILPELSLRSLLQLLALLLQSSNLRKPKYRS